MINIDSEKVKALPFLTIMQSLLVTLPSGMLFLLLFKRELFFSFDYFRLIAISMAITSPVYIYATGIAFLIIEHEERKESLIKNNKSNTTEVENSPLSKNENSITISAAFFGSTMSMFIIYGVLYLSYRLNLHMSLAIEMIVSICIISYYAIRIKLLKDKSKLSPKPDNFD